ncbi:DctP family TRAP transporter solute-binding subunit [Alloyangia pacifica]|uniref:C4-dicarboxylate-binding protein DctP n=1 Tax=Alloyangia pacifica TaxID=311180 RepID=A0A1I6UZX6_9RHOB|nr:DctP family TRAP transporter solute-binding subunit [Alloyangia pacifica]SDI32359.1 C4-dicarboxylate-binding protein DctP [Alloyangia pacifica]SFT06963.1 C4-dicarboxylate-binding protein DctP [Alloyangia pacifica]
MTKFSKFLCSAAALSVMPVLAQAACDGGERVIKFSHVTAVAGHPKGEMVAALAERFDEQFDGTMCMEVFANSTLFSDDKVLEALMLGDVQLAAPDVGKFDAYTQKLQVFNLPFLFDSTEAVQAFTETEQGEEILMSMEGSGIIGLGWIFNGMRQFSANRPLVEPRDAAGLKFRATTSEVTEAMIAALDATPQALAFAEVYGALQTGVVDGQENTWSNIYTGKFYEVQDGVTETNHQFLTYLIVTSPEFLDSLGDDHEAFTTLVDEVSAEYNARANAANEAARQAIIDNGGTVRELTDEQRAAWVEVMKPVWKRFEADIGTEVIEVASGGAD